MTPGPTATRTQSPRTEHAFPAFQAVKPSIPDFEMSCWGEEGDGASACVGSAYPIESAPVSWWMVGLYLTGLLLVVVVVLGLAGVRV